MRRDTMRSTLMWAAALSCLATWPGRALAWDGFLYWYAPASGSQDMEPGSGGILGTGGAQDFGITCAHCHVESEGRVSLSLDFSPPLESLGGDEAYVPGQTYAVTATLTGEHRGLSGCGPYVSHTNGFAAAFEDASGTTAGVLISDSGQRSDACPDVSTLRDAEGAPLRPAGTTMVVETCHAVLSVEEGGQDARTTWQFSWIAPAAGTGEVTIHYGTVDGDCVMDSFNDDVQTGSIPLREASTAMAEPTPTPSPRRHPTPAWGLCAVLALVGARRRAA